MIFAKGFYEKLNLDKRNNSMQRVNNLGEMNNFYQISMVISLDMSQKNPFIISLHSYGDGSNLQDFNLARAAFGTRKNKMLIKLCR